MYDAIVIGARCAGCPTAMLLARQGHRVLLIDRATFPSDTVSTHLIHPHGAAALRRWGLLGDVIATGVPALPTMRFDFGPVVLDGTTPPVDGISEHYAPRRGMLDTLLLDVALSAGAELRRQATVTGLRRVGERVCGVRFSRPGGPDMRVLGRIVIGADGVHSTLAKQVAARTYHDKGHLTCPYSSYWSGIEAPRLTLYPRPGGAVAEIPTHRGLTCLYAAWPVGEFQAVRSNIAASFAAAIEPHAPGLAGRMHDAERQERFIGTGRIPNFFRQSHGSGWVLAGGAAYHKDPIGADVITDAFRDAKRLAGAVHAGLTGQQDLDTALAGCQFDREQSAMAPYELNAQFAALQPPTPELQGLLAALTSNQPDTDRFIGLLCGTVPVPEFFSSENMARIAGATAQATAVRSEAGVL
jgi:2-polyprenyl-6-methoxyphenol hydroxylase-like FAD-dependent oxidoreductase